MQTKKDRCCRISWKAQSLARHLHAEAMKMCSVFNFLGIRDFPKRMKLFVRFPFSAVGSVQLRNKFI